MGRLGLAQLLLKKNTGTLVDVEQPAALLRLARFFLRRILHLRHGDAEFVGDYAHRFGEGDVLDLLNKTVDIT